MKTPITFLVSCLISVFSFTATAGDFGAEITSQSRYYGVGWQNNGNHWSIELLLTEKGGQIAYPSLDCTGIWTLQKRNAARMEYMEQILVNTKDCIELGTVILEPGPNDSLIYTWQEQVTTIGARAVLLPVMGERLTYMDLLKETLNTVDMDFLLPEYFK